MVYSSLSAMGWLRATLHRALRAPVNRRIAGTTIDDCIAKWEARMDEYGRLGVLIDGGRL